MEVFLWICIGFAAGWVARRESARQAAENKARSALKSELEQRAASEHNSAVAAGLRELAKEFGGTFEESGQVDEPHKHDSITTKQPTTRISSPQHSSNILTKDIREFDSVSVLLYFGAFLMIAGVALFVGLSSFSGAVKTVAVFALALTLYAAGLLMYRRIERLKPAGVALTAIGLVCLPLTGVAANFYAAGSASTSTIWFVTSMVSLGLYLVALWQIRQSLIGYMSVFMTLSLWMSIVAVIQAPIYFFGWATVLLGMAYLLAIRYLRLWNEIEMPLSVSASIMVPTALLLTVIFGLSRASMLHQGVTMLLTAVFYALATWSERKDSLRRLYFTLSYALIPLGVFLIVTNATNDSIVISFALSIVAVMQLIVVNIWLRSQRSWYRSALIVGAATLAVSTLNALPFLALTPHWGAFAELLAFNMVIHLAVALWSRSRIHLSLGLILMLSLPSVVGFLVLQPHASIVIVCLIYVAMAAILMPIGHALRSFGFAEIIKIAYALALLIAWLYGLNGQTWVPMVVSSLVGLVVVAAAYYERVPQALYAATILGAVAVLQGLIWKHVGWGGTVVAFACGLGVVYYLASKVSEYLRASREYNDVWLVSGLSMVYVGSLFGLSPMISWQSVGFLALAGLLSVYEARLRSNNNGVYLGGSVILFALQLCLSKLGLHEWQLYWYMWAAYVVLISYLKLAPMGIGVSGVISFGGLVAGLSDHAGVTVGSVSVAGALLFIAYYLVGKAHMALPNERWKPLVQAWSYVGLGGLYLVATLPLWTNGSVFGYTSGAWNALMLMLAGALTTYETYLRRSRNGMYLGAAAAIVGLQWLLYTQALHNVQVYSLMWAAYFAVLTWLADRDKRDEEKKMFTIFALTAQSLPPALLALGGDTATGLALLLESILVMLFGLWIRYRLVAAWGLSVAVGSVLYQLRDFQFIVLVALGAGVIGLGVYLLLRQEKK